VTLSGLRVNDAQVVIDARRSSGRNANALEEFQTPSPNSSSLFDLGQDWMGVRDVC